MTVIEKGKQKLDEAVVGRDTDGAAYWLAYLEGATEQRKEDIENAFLNRNSRPMKCSECVHYLHPSGNSKISKCYRPFRGGQGGGNMKPDDYCSYWSRKGGVL